MAKQEIPKAYEPNQYEDDVYAAWEKSGFFNPDRLPGKRKETFSIVLPPPNVTGTLHLGHAAMLAIEDIMTRFARLRGKKALWIPGTDHAAIATQTKVEQLLMKEGIKDPRRELGREAFLGRVKQFATQSHDTIVSQCRKMGASLDWSREAYTLDEPRSRAVRTAFKMMYDDGLIYRRERVVNWCPRCQSTLADDELEHKETKAVFVTFRYDKAFPIAIATTRPETKFGDTAVAVHPDDARYAAYVGKTFQTTFVGKPLTIKIVADPSVDPAFGTGALGVTPAHSNIDADMAVRHGLPFVQVIGEDGKMTAEVGSAFAGLPVKEVRAALIERLRADGLIEKEEEVSQNLSVCYRCGFPIEPLPKLQWFVNVTKPFAFRQSKHAPIKGLKNGQEVTLKSLMQHVVHAGEVAIMPESFVKTYFHWIDNLRDWNISRQIWFGHRVPVWYCAEGKEVKCLMECRQPIVSVEPPAECPACHGTKLEQDPDTLDTWFSSGLWTISTLGWPERTKDFKMFHPTSVLETGHDILFFWVARMILMTTYVVGEVPFRQVYLHGLVRDEKGRKMSKSLGNVIDPLDMIARYGADATRLSLVIGSTPGNDIKLSEEKIAGYRNFTNKLWNISRFVLTSVETVETVDRVKAVTLADRWMLSRFGTVVRDVTARLEANDFSAAGELLREFTWGELADWYLEIAKLQKSKNTDRILLYLLERLLALWHPFMPFVTETIWKTFATGEFLMVGKWPTVKAKPDAKAEEAFHAVMDVITALRNLRAEYKVEPSKEINATVVSADKHVLFAEQADVIKRLARVGELTIAAVGDKPEGAASTVVGTSSVFVPLAGLVDQEKEAVRLTKELEETKTYLTGLESRLGNAEFISKAPEKVVAGLKAKKADAEKKIAELEKQLRV